MCENVRKNGKIRIFDFDGGSVKTGDSGVTVAVLGLLLSAAGLTYLLRRKRHS